ncbi:MAG: hypothetical protein JNN12_09980 [Bacteroidetes Order II. Incertae sedis bacterium]|nr:hypothetical protein [Bacteroidetes Order II. bacterium]
MKFITKLGMVLCFAFVAGLLGQTNAQSPLSATQVAQLKASNKGFLLGSGNLPAAERNQLKALLKDVDPKLYFVRFADGTTMGKKNLGLSEVKAVSKIRRPGSTQGITFIVEGPEYVYIYTTDFQAFQSKIGQEKALKIQQLANRF